MGKRKKDRGRGGGGGGEDRRNNPIKANINGCHSNPIQETVKRRGRNLCLSSLPPFYQSLNR